jgi:type II secretory ATPase GspE/PulE/Tfp pilus assembly ATPase PilB-like protein
MNDITSNKKIENEIEISAEFFEEIKEGIKSIKSLEEGITGSFSANTTETLKTIFSGAINLDASDVHIEPEEDQVKLRLRIDGLLQDVLFFDFKYYEQLLSRIKLLSGVKLNVSDIPQDGRFTVKIGELEIETRISTLPSEYGESVVIRILNPQNVIEIKDLGLRKDFEDLFLKEISKPNGMVLVTGPTGSGKSTTLYSFLQKISKPEVKIITIEDPIEYHLDDIVQTQVDQRKGFGFAEGLRSIVRQDPDVILVGEMRDPDTAETAIQAALTGHLVLTTLHTNDAAGTIARLISLGSNPANIGPAVNLVIAQRLVRKVCPNCGKKVSSHEIYEKLKEDLADLPISIEVPEISENTEISVAEGCEFCNFTGYKGRIGIFEALPVDEDIETFIIESPYISALRKKMKEKGVTTMYQDGLIKVLQGITTLEEVERVTRE